MCVGAKHGGGAVGGSMSAARNAPASAFRWELGCVYPQLLPAWSLRLVDRRLFLSRLLDISLSLPHQERGDNRLDPGLARLEHTASQHRQGVSVSDSVGHD